MPTVAHSLERRLLRRSLDNILDRSFEDRPSRRSLTNPDNKENFGIHFIRNSLGNTSLTALHDLSNGKSPIRPEPTVDNLRRQTFGGSPIHIKRLNRRDREMTSPARATNRLSLNPLQDDEDVTPLTHIPFLRNNHFREESLSSSRMGDVTLDRMLDAIIESARRDVKKESRRPQKKIDMNDTSILYGGDDEEQSIHEMEVRTPTHLKRQKVVRRKKGAGEKVKRKELLKAVKEEKTSISSKSEEEINVKSLERPVGETIPRETLLTPEDPDKKPCFFLEKTPELLTNIDISLQDVPAERPPSRFERTPDIQFNDDFSLKEHLAVRCSTPALPEAQSIKRCLSFSWENDMELKSLAKKKDSLSPSFIQKKSSPNFPEEKEKVKGDLAFVGEDLYSNVQVNASPDLGNPVNRSVLTTFGGETTIPEREASGQKSLPQESQNGKGLFYKLLDNRREASSLQRSTTTRGPSLTLKGKREEATEAGLVAQTSVASQHFSSNLEKQRKEATISSFSNQQFRNTGEIQKSLTSAKAESSNSNSSFCKETVNQEASFCKEEPKTSFLKPSFSRGLPRTKAYSDLRKTFFDQILNSDLGEADEESLSKASSHCDRHSK